jgi:hypothetical protein
VKGSLCEAKFNFTAAAETVVSPTENEVSDAESSSDDEEVLNLGSSNYPLEVILYADEMIKQGGPAMATAMKKKKSKMVAVANLLTPDDLAAYESQKAVEKAGVARRREQRERSFKEKDAGVEKKESRKRNSRLSNVGGGSGAGKENSPPTAAPPVARRGRGRPPKSQK